MVHAVVRFSKYHGVMTDGVKSLKINKSLGVMYSNLILHNSLNKFEITGTCKRCNIGLIHVLQSSFL